MLPNSLVRCCRRGIAVCFTSIGTAFLFLLPCLRFSRRSLVYGCHFLTYHLYEMIGIPSPILDLRSLVLTSDFKFVDIPRLKVKPLDVFIEKFPRLVFLVEFEITFLLNESLAGFGIGPYRNNRRFLGSRHLPGIGSRGPSYSGELNARYGLGGRFLPAKTDTLTVRQTRNSESRNPKFPRVCSTLPPQANQCAPALPLCVFSLML